MARSTIHMAKLRPRPPKPPTRIYAAVGLNLARTADRATCIQLAIADGMYWTLQAYLEFRRGVVKRYDKFSSMNSLGEVAHGRF
jgi:hypothetical protein